MDIRQKNTWLHCWNEKKNREIMLNKIILSEVIGITYNACQPKQKNRRHKGHETYKRWYNKLYNRLFPGKVETVWQRLKRRKKATKQGR
jgi:hypothetical protein